jgi:sulfite reductase beta subunit-like hemoprotein
MAAASIRPSAGFATGDTPITDRLCYLCWMEPSTTTGRKGTLENPEVREDVPGHVIPILQREFDDFDNEAERFLGGEIAEDEFIGFRLKQGVYGQRQADVQMVRVKLPFGGVTPEQMETFADVIERWVPLKKGHITTRQNIQMHHVPLRDAAALIRTISDAGLSSREGCGNTVRNVTADPWAGICHDEVFDPTPYAGAYVRYFVRHPTTQLMPRKVKTAFTGSDTDRALTGIHDVAFIARERDGVRGFEMRIGGGTSIMPRVAPTLVDFVRADDGEYLKWTEAVLRIYDRQDWLRPNRARARLKVMVDKIGIEAMRELVEEELEGDWVHARDFSPVDRLFLHDEEAGAPDPPVSPGSPNGDLTEFRRFVEANVEAQRQEGFSAVQVKVPRGDLIPEQFRGLAAIMREYSGGYARTTVHQNFVLRWVRDEAVYDVWTRLQELGLGEAGADQINDVVSCPGTDSCKLGITSSMGLNRAVSERIEAMNITDPLTRGIHIKMSGCPNGCSQHHIGNIGFYGASIKVGENTIPAYVAHIGGNYEAGEIVYGTRLKVRLPAKRVPDAIERWLRKYEAEREAGEGFNAYAARVGSKEFEDAVRDLAMPVEFGLESMNQFIDWDRKVPFQVIRGEGECAV